MKIAFSHKFDDSEKKFDVSETYLIGYFKDSLPLAIKQNLFRCFAILRLDGDLYESTYQALDALYPFLNPGGIVIIDDFYVLIGANTAVLDYKQKHNINTPIIQVYHNQDNKEFIVGAYFMKPLDSTSLYC